MDDTKKQIKLESVKVQEATSKENQETLSEGTLIKGILKLVGRWIPENSSKELSEEEMFDITFRDSDHDKNRAKKIISSEVHRIHSIIKNLYLFSWDEIPGNDSVRLIDFLKQNYSIDWVKTATIEKIDDDKTIKVSTEKNYLSLKLNDEKTEVNLKIDDGRADKFIVKTENGKLNILSKDQNNVAAKTDLKLLDSINKCFLALAIEPVTKDFFTVVLGNESLKSNTSFENHVKKFNVLSMYFFGNFEQAYKTLRSASTQEIKKYYSEIFPDENEKERRIKKYIDERLSFDDIREIEGWDLWCLGYLARSYLSSINENRKKLLPVLEEAKRKGISDEDAFDKMPKHGFGTILLDRLKFT